MLSFVLVVFVIIALLGVVVVGIPFFLRWLAEENILFTTVKEGTAKAIMRGNSFDRFVMSFAGYHLNDPEKDWCKSCPEWDVLYHGKNNKDGFDERDAVYDDRSPLLKHLGLYWVGWPWANSVYVYAFEWNETRTDRSGKEIISPRAEATDFIFVADFTYAILTEEAETEDRLPVDILTLATVAIRNPYRALFSGEDWIRRVTAAINRHSRGFVGNKKFQDLISSKIIKWTEFSEPIIKLSEELPDDQDEPPFGLKGRYGADIRTADLQTIELSGDAKTKTQDATTRAYVAEQEAAATRLTGQAEADVIEMKGEKEASALAKRLAVITANGEAGALLAQLDAMQESSKGSGNTVIWANNPFVPLAGMMKPEVKGGEKP